MAAHCAILVTGNRIIYVNMYVYLYLLPTRSEEKGVLGVGSIPITILPSCHDIVAYT